MILSRKKNGEMIAAFRGEVGWTELTRNIFCQVTTRGRHLKCGISEREMSLGGRLREQWSVLTIFTPVQCGIKQIKNGRKVLWMEF